jgi:hypothetical protein
MASCRANTNGASVGAALNWFKCTLQNAAGEIEIVYVRTRASGSSVLTNVLRGQEGTTARAYAVGDTISLRLTAVDIENLQGSSGALEALLSRARA